MVTGSAVTALHFTDPGCPWAYSARPAQARLVWRFGSQVEWRLVLIGLSEHASDYQARGVTPARLAAGMPTLQARFGMPFARVAKQRVAATSRGRRVS